MTKKIYQLETLSCPTCAGKIEAMLKKTNGIEYAEVAFISSRVKLTYDEDVISSDEIKQRISKFGYRIIGEK